MDRQAILPILYDIAVTIGGETSLQPLLTRTLQRLLYYTSYPTGMVCLDAGHATQGPDVRTQLHAAVGDLDLIDAVGQEVSFPRALLAGPAPDAAAQCEILQSLHPVSGRYRSFLRLHVAPRGVIILLAPVAPETRLPVQQMFNPVLAHLARAILLCQRNDAYTTGLQTEMKLYAEVFQSSASGVMITDLQGSIVAVNPAFTRITGYAADEALGQNPRLLSSHQHDPTFYREMWESVREHGHWQGEVRNRRKSGESFPEWLNISVVRDPDGRMTHYVGIFSDISVEKQTEVLLHRMAFYDALTNLPNRRLMMDRLLQAGSVSARNGQYAALLFLDIDDFKDINDAKGHEVGDQVLGEVAQRLLGSVREGDTVARLGGDEFVVILNAVGQRPQDAAAHAKTVAEKIRGNLARPYTLDAYTVHTSPSIGIVLFQGQQENVDTLLKQADIAMYRAKRAGGNDLRFFDPRMQDEINARIGMVDALREAIGTPQLSLFAQPQFDHRQQVIGAELLLRWQHPQWEGISPEEFIPLAEDSGLIVDIGLWCLKATCEQLVKWSAHAHARSLTLALNLSPRQFKQADFVDQLRQVLCATGANPQHLKLELTEGVMLENPEDAIAKIKQIKKLGVRFALDDFGTGYSSLQYLKQLPIDQIKIDQSFIRDIETDINNAAIVKTIIAMSHAMGLEVIAEGVETQAQLDFLELNGCLHYQGYLFARPMPLSQLEALLQPGSSLAASLANATPLA